MTTQLKAAKTKAKNKTDAKTKSESTIKTKPNRKDTKAAVEKILERHRLKLKNTKSEKVEKKKPTKAPEQRKRIKLAHKASLGSGLKELSSQRFAAYQAREVVKKLEAKGLSLGEVKITTAVQKVLALQVRNKMHPTWGTLRGFDINDYTPDAKLRQIRKELKDLQLGWMISNYFGFDAEYRIVEIERPAQVSTY